MSKVYSFRLDENNPREAQAIAVINAWASKGYSLRCFLVEAIMSYSRKPESDEIIAQLKHIEKVILKFGEKGNFESGEHHSVELPQGFIDSLKRSTKKGIRAR